MVAKRNSKALGNATSTMRRVRKLSPCRQQLWCGTKRFDQPNSRNYKIFGISLVVMSDYCPGIIYCFDEYYDRIGN
jgi:hypothetical protein